MTVRFVAVVLLACWHAFALEVELDFGQQGADALPSAVLKEVEEAYSLNQQGLALLDKEDLGGAMALFDEAVAMVPQYSDAHNNRGVVFYRRGIIHEARTIWTSLAQRDPRYLVALHNLGVVAYHEKKFEDARRWFDKALKINRRQVETLVLLGRMELEMGKGRTGVEYLERAYAINAAEHDIWSSYAWGLLQVGDTASAQKVLRSQGEQLDALRLLGGIAAKQGRHAEATDLLSRAAQKGAGPEVLYGLALAQEAQGEYAGALTTLDQYFARAGAGTTADAWLLAGIAAKGAQRLAESVRFFEEGVRRFPADVIMAHNLGQLYFLGKEFDKAEKIWKQMGDTLSDPSLMQTRALVALRRGDLAAATQLVRKGLELDNRAELHDLYGVILHREGKRDEAAAQFKKALGLNPQLRSAQLNLALLSQSGPDLILAARSLQAQLRSCGDSCAAIALRLSIVLYHQGDAAKAAEVLQGVAAKDRDERVYRHWALYLRSLNELSKAIAVLEEARVKLVLEIQTEAELADLYLLAGQYREAAAVLAHLLERWEGNPWRIYYQMGYAAMGDNDLAKAKSHFEKSLKLKKDNVAARGLLAYVHNRLGDSQTARALWEQNLKDDPDNPALWINMGLAYEAQGENGRALDAYRKAQQLEPSNKGISVNLGNALVALGRTAEARDAYMQALDSPQREIAAWNLLLLALRERNRPRAGEMNALALREFPRSDYTKRSSAELTLYDGDTLGALRLLGTLAITSEGDWHQMARLHALRGNAAQARTCLDKLPQTDLWNQARTDIAAQIAYGEGKCDDALRLWAGVADTSFAFRYNVALAAYQCKRFGDVLERATQLVGGISGRDRADVCRLAGNAAFALKDWNRARFWYDQLSNVEAGSAVVQYNLAVAHYNLGDIERSWGYYQRARQLDPSLTNTDIEKRHGALSSAGGPAAPAALDSLEQLYNTAVEYHQNGNDTAAQLLYIQIVNKNPLLVQAWNNLGAIYSTRGELDSAQQCFLKAVEKKYDLPESYANLINVYLAQENYSQARRWVIKGRGHNPDSELLAQIEQVVADSLSKAKSK